MLIVAWKDTSKSWSAGYTSKCPEFVPRYCIILLMQLRALN